MNKKFRNLFILVLAIVIVAFSVWALWSDGNEKGYMVDLPDGKKETCISCHSGISGFSEAHAPEKIGCSSCHLGNPAATKKEKAHKDMVLIPGNLSTANKTCATGLCHPGIDQRVQRSLMTTMSGVISVNRFVFGESDTLTHFYHVDSLGFSAADTHLRNLCASCHLGREKLKAGPISEASRGGGCNACHLNYSEAALAGHYKYHDTGLDSLSDFHPSLSLKITNEHCFGCHSRSGRISLGYEGWHETRLRESDVAGDTSYRILPDHRILRYVSEDVHHTAGLDCIDCHDVEEVMGDAEIYLHKEDALRIRCADCHFEGEAETVTFDDLGAEYQKIAGLRKISEDKPFLIGKESERAMINAFYEDGKAWMLGKNTGKRFQLNPPARICTKGDAHDEMSCSACHTAWAPQCVGCHQDYDTGLTSIDLLTRKKVEGKWVEYLGEFFAEAPTLGVVDPLHPEKGEKRSVKTFIPGMIMTIDKSGFPGSLPEDTLIHHRLFAPGEAHTTMTKGHNCKDCHNNPLAIGYGRGELTYSIEGGIGQWHFEAEYEDWEYDGLPQDAWIGFLENSKRTPATRPNARPFNPKEQKRILTVGACLTCHAEDSKVMVEGLVDFQALLKRVRVECVLPKF